jgi:hypothetical protein
VELLMVRAFVVRPLLDLCMVGASPLLLAAERGGNGFSINLTLAFL